MGGIVALAFAGAPGRIFLQRGIRGAQVAIVGLQRQSVVDGVSQTDDALVTEDELVIVAERCAVGAILSALTSTPPIPAPMNGVIRVPVAMS